MILRGALGFAVVSVAGFVPWAVFGKWFRGHGGEIGMYAICALVFIALSGLLLHRLILGKGSLGRFFKLFSLIFSAYSVAWIAGWMALRGHPGSIAGLAAGTLVMGLLMVAAFDAWKETLKVILALFLLNSAGYFLGGWIEDALVQACECSGQISPASPTTMLIAKLQWGVCYGLGLGAGLGLAFYFCQKEARRILSSENRD